MSKKILFTILLTLVSTAAFAQESDESHNSAQTRLEKLNLQSMHMVPPRVKLFANPGHSGILPQVPFALDKILDKPGSCVE
jgi:hypothetical protein